MSVVESVRKIPLFKVAMSENIGSVVTETLKSGYIGQGPKVEQFEKLLRGYLGNPFVNTVNCATSGIHLCLHVLKDGVRDEVLTAPLTCAATNLPILANSLKVRWVDVDRQTCNMDLVDLRRKLSPKTLAIMVVHWGGYPVDLDELKSIQQECQKLYGFTPMVIEDCAHAFGAKYKGQFLANHGNLCVFSFQAIKHLTTGDGGMIVSPNAELHQRIKLLRWYGLDRTASFSCEQNISDPGFKFHMNDIAATIGYHNFSLAHKNLVHHRANAKYIRSRLSGVDKLTFLEDKLDRESSYWVLTVLVERRQNFIRQMADFGIEASRVHDRNDNHSCFKNSRCSLPTMDWLSERYCCLPCGWWLNWDDLDYMVDCIRRGW